jgi:hypothetical protein
LVGFRAANPRTRRCDAGLRVFDLCLKIPGVQLRKKLSSLHDGIEICVKLLNLARDLAADLNRNDGLNNPGGIHDLA